jgi:hypothetical protein
MFEEVAKHLKKLQEFKVSRIFTDITKAIRFRGSKRYAVGDIINDINNDTPGCLFNYTGDIEQFYSKMPIGTIRLFAHPENDTLSILGGFTLPAGWELLNGELSPNYTARDMIPLLSVMLGHDVSPLMTPNLLDDAVRMPLVEDPPYEYTDSNSIVIRQKYAWIIKVIDN